MKHAQDPLYSIFEKHLYNSLVEEESTEEFAQKVIKDYMSELTRNSPVVGALIPTSQVATIQADLKEEVLEMLRKKTYGHFNLAEFRRAKAAAPKKAKVTHFARTGPKRRSS